MVLSRSFSSLLLSVLAFVSLSAGASPHPRVASKTATLKLAARINSHGMKNITAADRDRARAFQNIDGPINLINARITYTASIGVGDPITSYTVVVDSGGANTWIGAGRPYVPTGTSQDTGETFDVIYDGGESGKGKEYTDTITISPDLIIVGSYIGAANSSVFPAGFDGILGLGPAPLSEGTVTNLGVIPTVLDDLYAQGQITSANFGVFFSPFSPASAGSSIGELSFGGYDADKIVGPLNEVDITSVTPSASFWGIDLNVRYGSRWILALTAGIIDTGTTLILIASDTFSEYKDRTGATLDPNTGLLMITLEQYNNLQSLFFNIGGTAYELTPNAQIWPRSLNAVMGGTIDGIYLVISDIGRHFGSGMDVVLGYCFLERFYVVFDAQRSKVALAMTEYTYATIN